MPLETPSASDAAPPTPRLDRTVATSHNVPAALSAFVGRERDLAEVAALLGRARLVTLAGPGGVGKTRLARETAACASASAPAGQAFPDGVWWVELAPLPAGADPVPAVAAALGVRPPPGGDGPGTLVDMLAVALAGRRLLLVLDNCEHVIDGAAALADLLLRRCPGLTLFATSREALGVEGEVVWPVTVLAHPPARPDGSDRLEEAPDRAAELLAYDAVRLFVERARAVQPGFALTARTAGAVAATCARLDGLPLALELAAAQVATLGIEALAARLDDVFAVLTRGRRTVLPRHKTLRALLDWSHHLLAPAERALLARLGVFRGAFSIEAVEAVCAAPAARLPGEGEGEALVALGRLVEQSLVQVDDEARDETRYRLLETVRQYALARLAEHPGEERRARAAHAAWVRGRTAAAAGRTWGPALRRTVRALEREVAEIRAALDWAVAHEPITAVHIVGALAWFWISAGVPWAEARARTAAGLAAADAEGVADAARRPADQAALAEALYPLSGLAFFAGEPERMLALSARAEPLWAAVDAARGADPALDRSVGAAAVRGRATMRGMAGLALAMRGETDAALVEMSAAIDIAREGGDAWWHAVLLQRRGLVAAWGGRLDGALPDFAASVERLRALGDSWFLALGLEGLSGVELVRGAPGDAARHARESVAVLAEEPDPWFVSRGLDALATVAVTAATVGTATTAVAPERAATAARLLGAAAALRERCGAEVIGPDLARYEATVAAARTALGGEFSRHWEDGAALDLPGAFALAAGADVAPAADRSPADGPGVVAPPLPPLAPPASERPAPAAGTPEHVAAVGGPALRIEIRAFGSLAVVRDGVPLPRGELTPAKARELLLYLVLHRAGRTKEQIALALWPESSPAQVRNAFHVAMHQLRRILGHKDAITFDGRAYALAATGAADAVAGGVVIDCDVHAVLDAMDAVRRSVRATARQGTSGAAVAAALDTPTLVGWWQTLELARRGALGEGDDARDWVVAEQDRLRAAWGDGLEGLARLHILRGEVAQAASVLETLVNVDELREGAHRALMAAWASSGEPARALAHYEALGALLRREVGGAPAPETRALAASIRRGA